MTISSRAEIPDDTDSLTLRSIILDRSSSSGKRSAALVVFTNHADIPIQDKVDMLRACTIELDSPVLQAVAASLQAALSMKSINRSMYEQTNTPQWSVPIIKSASEHTRTTLENCIKAIDCGDDHDLRIAFQSLYMLGSEEAISVFEYCFRKPRSEFFRLQAALALTDLGRDTARTYLLQRMEMSPCNKSTRSTCIQFTPTDSFVHNNSEGINVARALCKLGEKKGFDELRSYIANMPHETGDSCLLQLLFQKEVQGIRARNIQEKVATWIEEQMKKHTCQS